VSRAVDTNVLVDARREGTTNHAEAATLLRSLAEGPEPWGLPWPCIYEFLRIVTHPRVFHPPMTLECALEGVRDLLASLSARVLRETDRHLEIVERVLRDGRAPGNLVHHVHIVALLVENAFDELVYTDEGFRRFRSIRVTNLFR
jgi:hypothetical protein